METTLSSSQPQPKTILQTCTATSIPRPTPNHLRPYQKTTGAEKFPIEKRRPSVITSDRKRREGLVDFEIGWKRTKEIKIEKPKGWVIANFLEKLETHGDGVWDDQASGQDREIVAERAREETEVLRENGEVDDRMVTELYRVLRLLEMDLTMVKAAKKEETLGERLEQAKIRCKQAILVALSF